MAKLTPRMGPELAIVLVVIAVAVIAALVITRRRGSAIAAPPQPAPLPRADAPRPAATPASTASDVETEPAPGEPVQRPPLADTVPRMPRAVPTPAQPRERPSASAEHGRHEQRATDRDRIRAGLAKTRGGFVSKLARLLLGKPKVDRDLRDAIEEVLFTADIGTHVAQSLMDRVGEALDRREIADADAVWSALEQAALELLSTPAPPPSPAPPPYVLLMIGVNGVGKTTTLGKLAARHVAQGRKVLLVAGDTFRAGAVAQLDVWAQRVGCDIHMADDKADPSSVVFDGILRGRREGHDVVLCDTAGRLHTRKELMDELGKVRRAAAKAIAHERPAAEREAIVGPHDTWLVLDATIGQNALAQAKLFKETTDFTGLVVTKLDGTAKGGVVLGVCDELRVPIRYVGVGEGVDDLRPFEPADFVAALFADRERIAAEDR
ncbi:MAG: signal recognition particle-docking protein FtsY [Nannocystaceae bacterium]|nr:signal recognition particle-docking protein FtsY [Nannocystaceae bacterium]